MKKGCALAIGLYLGLAAGYYALFRDRYDPPAPWVAALVGALVSSLAVGFLGNARQARRDASLIRRASRGERPEDGKMWAATGTIQPIEEPLLSPFRRRPCVAYAYEVFTEVTRRSGNRTETSKSMECSGFALTPSTVRGLTGGLRLLGFPFPDQFPKERVDTPEGRAAAREYVDSASFTALEGFAPGRMYREIKDVMTDDDGSVRKDWQMARDAPDVEHSILEETVIPAGAAVTVFGKYSAAKNGLVPDVGGSGTVIRIFPGANEAVANRQGRSATGYLVVGLLLLAATQAGLALLLEHRQTFFAPDRERALIDAARSGDTVAIAGLLRRRTRADAVAQGTTALVAADDAATVRFLLDHGASPDLTDDSGQTPLMAAARRGSVEKLEMLIAAGANLNARARGTGETALIAALDGEQDAAAEALRRAGAADETVTASNGEPVVDAAGTRIGAEAEEGPLAACRAYLAAVQAEDLARVRDLSSGRDASAYTGIDWAAWKGARIVHPALVRGYRNATAATLTVRGQSGGGFEVTWVYQMIQHDGRWRVSRERWLTKAGEPAEAETPPEPSPTP